MGVSTGKFLQNFMRGLRHNFLSCQENQRAIFKELVTFVFYKGAVISLWSLTPMCAKNTKSLKELHMVFLIACGKI